MVDEEADSEAGQPDWTKLDNSWLFFRFKY